MKLLSGLDASFLHLETPEMPMHVGGLNLFDLPEGYTGDFHEDVKKHIVSRMHLATIFTKKLALMPFDLANPVWVEDGDVDIDYHIRRITLPKPGTMAQLEAYVGRLHSSLLDRSRPLWEFYTFDGLKPGQAAFYSKIHHAALDGQGGQALAQAMLDVTPEPRATAPAVPRSKAPYQPSVKDMVGAAFRNTLVQYWKMVKFMPSAVKALGGLVVPAKGEDGKRRIGFPKNFKLAPKTPLNVAITNQRVFATVTVPLNEAKELAKAYDGSLNDSVMAICSGAMRRYLAAKDALPKKSLVVALPVSLREEGNTELNNQVSMMLVNLATEQADVKKRMRTIVKSSNEMKVTLSSLKSVMPTDFPSLGAPWLMSGLVSLYGRSKLADKMPPIANVVISNVPGPRVPLYMAGARMSTYFPVSIVTHGLALNITVQSYNGALDFGLIACRRAMPDVREFARLMTEAHQELMATLPKIDAKSAQKNPVAAAPKVPAKKAALPKNVQKPAEKVPAAKAVKAAKTPIKKVVDKSAEKVSNTATVKTRKSPVTPAIAKAKVPAKTTPIVKAASKSKRLSAQ